MKSLPADASPASRNREIASLVDQVRLPFRSRAWRGSSGAWQGQNQGSSIDFQDHRAYAPGDDPRHLDWAAYARTNHYTMKLFREEVSPRLDVALDVSRSMALTPEKESRALALFGLVLRTALHDGISARLYLIHSAGQWQRLETASGLALDAMPAWDLAPKKSVQLPLREIPWRNGSLRVLISDLLVPQPPEKELSALSRDHGRTVIFAPYLKAESEPDWHGNLELHDCETSEVSQRRIEPFVLARYRKSYERHFELWQLEARRRSLPLARISCELSLSAAVRQQALPAGVLEVRH